MAGGSNAVCSVLRNVQEPARSWAGDRACMKHPLPRGNAAGQQPPAGTPLRPASATRRREGGSCPGHTLGCAESRW